MAEEAFIESDNPFLSEELFGTAEPEDLSPSADSGNVSAEQHTPDQLAQMRLESQTLQRFNQDPEFARQVLETRARQLGLTIQAPQQTPPTPRDAPEQYVATVRDSLPPELQFLAPHIAKATWNATEARIEPLTRAQQQQDAQQRQTSYDTMARELSTEAPGWERYEDEMLSILGFLRGAVQGQGPMVHQKYGSALKLLYRLAAGEGQATANAGRRMQQALRNGTRSSSGGPTRGGGPSIETMIAQQKTPQQKWQVAFQHALREHGLG